MSASLSLFRPPQQLVSYVPVTISAIAIIDSAVARIEELTIPACPQVPTLGPHLQAAKDHGRVWMSLTRGEVVGALSAILTWSVSFRAQLDQLMQVARSIAQGNTQEVGHFKDLLNHLRQQTQQQRDQVQAVRSAVLSFVETVDGDARNFNQDEGALQSACEAQQQMVDSLNQEVESLQAEIAEKRRIEAALSILDPLYWILKKLIESLLRRLHGTEDQLDAARSRLSEAQEQFQQTTATKAVLGQYQQSNGSLSTGINALSNGWDTLDANFRELYDSENIQDIQDLGAFGPDAVNAVLKDWDDLVRPVRQLLDGAGEAFRIMHCQTGLYITMDPNDAGRATLTSTQDSNQLFVMEKAGDNDYRLRNVKYNVYLTYFANWKYLGGYSSTGYEDQHWGMEQAGGNTGIHLFNRCSGFGGNNHLFYKDNGFGLYFGDYPDQLWLLQYESFS